MKDFKKLMTKLQPMDSPNDYVTDPYSLEDMNKDVSQYSSRLTPEDVEKIHYAETTGGKYLQSPKSTASGNYQIIDSTRKLAENLAKEQGFDTNEPNPLRKDAILMKSLVNKYENVLKNAKKGPYSPDLATIYLMHKNGIQGALNALNNPETPESKAKFKEVDKLLSRMPKKEVPAQDLLDLLGD